MNINHQDTDQVTRSPYTDAETTPARSPAGYPATPLDRTTFPHPPANGNGAVLATIENLEHLLAYGRFRARFNVIKKRLEVRGPSGSPIAMSEVVSLALQYGLGTGHIYQFVDAIGQRNLYNPVKEWILGIPWDGRDRLSEFYQTVTARHDYPAGLKETLLYRWLLSATVAAITERRFKARGVLTLQGEQGLGKTSWVANLMPAGDLRNDCIKLDHHLDGANKDSIIGAISHWITELGELDGSFRKDIARLKGFLTNDCDKLRRPYAREESEFSRRTVFAATVNEEAFLIDPTGNSRWWTIAVQKLDYTHSIDMQQLFAQLALDFRDRKQWWLTSEEEQRLAAYNLRHRSSTAIAERLRDHLDLEPGFDAAGKAMTAIEVLSELGISSPTNAQCKECGSALRELYGPPKRINGRDKWRVHLRRTGTTHPTLRLPEDDLY